jgi:hypothetical protein
MYGTKRRIAVPDLLSWFRSWPLAPLPKTRCHRVLESGDYAGTMSRHEGIISRRLLLSIEGTLCPSGKTLFDASLPVAPPRLSG